jgi:hypothetical protein
MAQHADTLGTERDAKAVAGGEDRDAGSAMALVAMIEFERQRAPFVARRFSTF